MNPNQVRISAGDEIVLVSGRLNKRTCSPFFTALAEEYTRVTRRHKKSRLFVMVTEGGSPPFEMARSVVRHVTQEDRTLHDDLKSRIKHLVEVVDENQHISSVSGEPKVAHKDEQTAWERAYAMIKRLS